MSRFAFCVLGIIYKEAFIFSLYMKLLTTFTKLIIIIIIIIIINSMHLVERCCLHKVPSVSTVLWLVLTTRDVQMCRPMLAGFWSFSTVRVHFCLGRPRGLFQSPGRPRITACRVRRWSISGSDLAMWPKSWIHLRRMISVAGVRFPISQLLIWWL